MQEMSRNQMQAARAEEIGALMREVQDLKVLAEEFAKERDRYKDSAPPSGPLQGRARFEIVEWLNQQFLEYSALARALNGQVNQRRSDPL